MDDKNPLFPLIAGLVIRHVVGMAAGWLVLHNLLDASQQASFAQMGIGIVTGGGVMAWSWWQKTGQAQALALLKKLTRTQTATAAVEVAKTLPAGSAVTKGLP